MRVVCGVWVHQSNTHAYPDTHMMHIHTYTRVLVHTQSHTPTSCYLGHACRRRGVCKRLHPVRAFLYRLSSCFLKELPHACDTIPHLRPHFTCHTPDRTMPHTPVHLHPPHTQFHTHSLSHTTMHMPHTRTTPTTSPCSSSGALTARPASRSPTPTTAAPSTVRSLSPLALLELVACSLPCHVPFVPTPLAFTSSFLDPPNFYFKRRQGAGYQHGAVRGGVGGHAGGRTGGGPGMVLMCLFEEGKG